MEKFKGRPMLATAEFNPQARLISAYRGDIYALEQDRAELAALGVEVGRFNPRYRCFEDCVVSVAVLERLQAQGSKFVWDLVPLR